MTTSLSHGAYEDCFDLFDRACASPIGIRYGFGKDGRGKAHHLRTRLHYTRTLSRREQSAGLEPDDPNYGKSPYDHLIVRVHEDRDGWWVYIEPRRFEEGKLEELGAAE